MYAFWVALLGTILIYVNITLFKSIYRFKIFNSIKKNMLLYSMLYLKDKTEEDFEREKYITYMNDMLKKKDLDKWVSTVDILWKTQLKLIISYSIQYNEGVVLEVSFPMNVHDFGDGR